MRCTTSNTDKISLKPQEIENLKKMYKNNWGWRIETYVITDNAACPEK